MICGQRLIGRGLSPNSCKERKKKLFIGNILSTCPLEVFFYSSFQGGSCVGGVSWRLFCHCMFLISPLCASRRSCFVILAFPRYLHIYFYRAPKYNMHRNILEFRIWWEANRCRLLELLTSNMSRGKAFPTILHVRPANRQKISTACVSAQSDQSLLCTFD